MELAELRLRTTSMPELMRREAPADTCTASDRAELGAHGGARPGAARRRSGDDAEERPDREVLSCGEPRTELLPGPLVHPRLAALVALAAANEDRATGGI